MGEKEKKRGREKLTLNGATDRFVAATPKTAPASIIGRHTEGSRQAAGHTLFPAPLVPRGHRGDGARGRG